MTMITMIIQNGMTCAHMAAYKGSVAVLKELMRFNKSVVTTNRNKVSSESKLPLNEHLYSNNWYFLKCCVLV